MNKNETLVVTHKVRLRFNETDALGIVWHGNYLKYFEDGREAFGRAYNISYLDAKKNGFATPIVKTTTDHKLTLKYGDVATVETHYINTDSAKIVFKYIIKNSNDKTVCVGETVQVFTSLEDDTMALVIPDFFKAWKLKYGLLDD